MPRVQCLLRLLGGPQGPPAHAPWAPTPGPCPRHRWQVPGLRRRLRDTHSLPRAPRARQRTMPVWPALTLRPEEVLAAADAAETGDLRGPQGATSARGCRPARRAGIRLRPMPAPPRRPHRPRRRLLQGEEPLRARPRHRQRGRGGGAAAAEHRQCRAASFPVLNASRPGRCCARHGDGEDAVGEHLARIPAIIPAHVPAIAPFLYTLRLELRHEPFALRERN